MNPFCKFERRAKGFTIIELIIVVVIIGILAAAVIVKFPGQSINIYAQGDQVVQDIRYTQALAMTQAAAGERYRILFGTTSYTISKYTPSTWTAIMTVSLASGITFTSNNFTGGYVAFDGLGQSYNGSVTTPMTASVTVGITGGGRTRTITVWDNTGAVEVS